MSSRKTTAATTTAATAKLEHAANKTIVTTIDAAASPSPTTTTTIIATTTTNVTTSTSPETTTTTLAIDDKHKSEDNNSEMGANVSLTPTTTTDDTVVVVTPTLTTTTIDTLANIPTTPTTTLTPTATAIPTPSTPPSSSLIIDEAESITARLQKTPDATTTKCTRVTRHSSPMLLLHSPTSNNSSSSKKTSSSLEDLALEPVDANDELNHQSTSKKSLLSTTTTITNANTTTTTIASTTTTITTPAGATPTNTSNTITPTMPIIRGRKSLKDLKDAKEALAAALRAAADKEEELMNATAAGNNIAIKTPTTPTTIVAAATATAVSATENLNNDETEKEENICIKDLIAKDNIKVEQQQDKEKDLTEVNATTAAATATTTTTTTTTYTNRLTRKAHAERLVTNTRVTRNRRQSMTSTAAAAAAAAAAITAEQQLKSLTTTARGRRKKLITPEPPATKRKRYDAADEEVGPTAEPGAKYIKIEVKEATPPDDDKELSPTTAAVADNDAIATPLDEAKLLMDIKGEPNDSSDDILSNASSEINIPIINIAASTTTTTTTRGRGRWHSTRNAKQQSLSPATRAATRQNKSASPATTTTTAAAVASVATTPVAAKRRRVGSTTRSNLNAKTTASLLAASATMGSGFGDDDSKDSLASSVDDLAASTAAATTTTTTTTTLLMANEIKVEKLTASTTIPEDAISTDFEAMPIDKDELHCVSKKSARTIKNVATTTTAVAATAVSPLTVDVSTSAAATNLLAESDETGNHDHDDDDDAMDDSSGTHQLAATALSVGSGIGAAGGVFSSAVTTPTLASSSSEKAASLSPELISEGVNVISVKRFYKKPEFLENNLGIEQDPKLGEIVQKASSGGGGGGDGVDETSSSSTTVAATANDKHLLVGNDDEAETEPENLDNSLKEGELRLTDTSSADSSTLLATNEQQVEKAEVAADVPASVVGVVVDDDGYDEAGGVAGEGVVIVVGKATTIDDNNDDKDADEVVSTAQLKVKQDSDEGVVVVKEEEEEEDAASEFNSMDNNCSLHEYAREDAEEDSDAPRQEDYDELENEIHEIEILEELEKAGVVDASGNPTSCANNQIKNTKKSQKHNNNDDSNTGSGVVEGKEKVAKGGNMVKMNKIVAVVVAADSDSQTTKDGTKAAALTKLEIEQQEQSKEHDDVTSDANVNKEENKENLAGFVGVIESSGANDATPIEQMEIDGDDDEADATIELSKQEKKVDLKLPVAARGVLKHEEALDEKGKQLLNEMTSTMTTSPLTVANDIKLKHEIALNNKIMLTTTTTSECIDEEQRRKQEQHLQNLGLLTHKAAEQVRQEFIQEATTRAAILQQHHQQQQQQQQHSTKRNGGNKGSAGSGTTLHAESTGTLKTVIKLNRYANGGNSCTTGVATGTVLTGSVGSSATTTSLTSSSSSTSTGGNARKGQGGGGGAGNSGGGAGGSAQHNHGVRRQSLKMTFQKGRGRGQGNTDRAADQHGAHGEDAYYTIQNENEGATKTATTNSNLLNVQPVTHGRKSYSRSNTTTTTATNNNHNHNINNNKNNNNSGCSLDSSHSEGQNDHQQNQMHSQQQQQQHHHHHYASGLTSAMSKKDDKEKILIPEKASSFKFHPGRLCEDQCYYCSGKFGLYDTPCHVGQIKSVERQQKILANEEKLTVDNCLCDACFRHVDRRANAAYKKRLSAPAGLETGGNGNKNAANLQLQNELNANDDVTANDATASTSAAAATAGAAAQRPCIVTDCPHPAGHSLRRKYIRKSVKKFLLNFEIPTGTPCVWLCQSHYDAVIQCSGCVLCKRRLGKNHMYHITSDTDRLEKALSEMGIPVQLGIGTAVCKLCRYFANLLMKPPDSTKYQKAEFVKNYRKRLLQFHNIHDASNDASEADEEEATSSSAAAAVNSGGNNAVSSKTTTSKAMMQQTTTTTKTKTTSDNVATTPAMLNNEMSNTAAGDTSTEMLVDYYEPNDSNSSHSSNSLMTTNATATASGDAGTQMSKLKAILQQSSSGGGGTANNNNSSTDTSATSTPTANDSKSKAANAADISNVLRANPNISMRELFHGEEELGLNFKVPFGCSSSQRTPEGWTRVQTFLQYDEPTRQLWEELQKPYGNQSSFLRHLILLEKYYRNGDLVLAPNASANATVYTKTVRQRLNSYDHGHCGGLTSVKPTLATATATMSSANSQATTIETAGANSKENSSNKVDKSKSNSSAHIPTVDLNDDDDDDDDDGRGVANVDDNNASAAHGAGISMADDDNANDDDNDCSEVPIIGASSDSSNDDTISVDKLTKQLSSNAVTIIARPKEANKQHQAIATSTDMLHESTSISSATTTTAAAAAATTKTPNKTAFTLKEISPINAAPPLVATGNGTNSGGSSQAVTNSRSILKSNLLGITKSTTNAVEIVPLSGGAAGSNRNPGGANNGGGGGGGGGAALENKQQKKILDVANKLLVNQIEAQAANSSNSKLTNLPHTTPPHQQQQLKSNRLAQHQPTAAQLLNSPPELISLHRGRRSSGSASGTVAAAAAAATASSASAATGTSLLSGIANKRLQLPKLPTARNATNSMGPNIVILPESLTPQERQQSRSWRPTLLPVNDQQHTHLLTKPGPLYQTADGRRLPGLVQVQSGGRPYLISIFDYNRMCILRREKILRDQMIKESKSKQQQQQHHHHQHQQQQQQATSSSVASSGVKNTDGSGGSTSSTNNNAFAAVTAAVLAAGMPKKVSQALARQQLQQLHQQQNQQQQQQQQQQQHQQQQHHHHQLASLKSAGVSGGNINNAGSSGSVGAGIRYPRLAPKQQQQQPQQVTMPPLGAISSTLGNAAVVGVNNATDNTSSWLWKNFPDASNFLINGGNAGVGAPKLPHLLTKPGGNSSNSKANSSSASVTATITSKQQQQQQQQQFLDNTIMTKIPKSLTVIPQHKLFGSVVAAANAVAAAAAGNNNGTGQKE